MRDLQGAIERKRQVEASLRDGDELKTDIQKKKVLIENIATVRDLKVRR
jgi:hypothetical protein